MLGRRRDGRRTDVVDMAWIACFGGVALIAAYLDREPRMTLHEVYRDLAFYLHRSYDLNEPRVSRLLGCVRTAWAVFGIDVLWRVVEFLRGA
jgi:hypothetical protein